MLTRSHWQIGMIAVVMLSVGPAQAQVQVQSGWVTVESPAETSMRGLHVVDALTIWASGAGGTVLRSVDAGSSWDRCEVPGADEFDFRDVHGFDGDNACLMVAGSPARLYRTQDGGKTWRIAFEDDREGAFFNAMDFWDDQHGIAFGDAIDGRLSIVTTDDAGLTWSMLPTEQQPRIDATEHGFAASGTCLVTFGDEDVMIGLGGISPDGNARILISRNRGNEWSYVDSQLPGGESAGLFSIVMIDERRGVAVGGDYQMEDEREHTLTVTKDGGESWFVPDGTGLTGYRSVVALRRQGEGGFLVATGPSGSDRGNPDTMSWSALAGDGYHAIGFSHDGRLGWAVGSEGRMARWHDGTAR